MDFSKMRANAGNQFAAMQKKMEMSEKGGFQKDPNIWKPVANKDNKFDGEIRFLSISKADYQLVEEGKFSAEDLTPLAKILKHTFQGPNGWFIENSLQTFGEDCPISAHDRPLWADLNKRGIKEPTHPERVELKKRLPKTEYYANILVIRDGTNPENNGKVFKYQLGETVRKMIESAKTPEFEGQPSIDAFNMWEGASLKLRLTYEKKTFGGRDALVPNFKNCEWSVVGPVGDDAFIEKLWNQSHSLLGYYDRKNFKTYEELEAKFNKVMGIQAGGKVATPGSTMGKTAENFLNESLPTQEAPAPAETKAPEIPQTASAGDAMARFEAMLAGNA